LPSASWTKPTQTHEVRKASEAQGGVPKGMQEGADEEWWEKASFLCVF